MYPFDVLMFVIPALSFLSAATALVGLPGEERTLTPKRLAVALGLSGIGVTSFALGVEVVKRV